MSAGIWHRLESLFHEAMHHHDVRLRKEISMTAFAHLKAVILASNAKIADLETRLAAAEATPAGPSDDDLNTLATSMEAALGVKIPDPDAPAAPVTVVVAVPTMPGTTIVPVAPDPAAPAAPIVGSAVSGPGIDPATTLQPGSTATTLVLSDPTTAAHAGDGRETLTITPPATATS